MRVECLQQLMTYKRWANRVLYAEVVKMTPDELTRQRPIVFGSLLQTLFHVWAMDRVWQAHLEGRDHGLTTRNPLCDKRVEDLRLEQDQLDNWYVDYVSAEPNLEEKIHFEFIGDGSAIMSREDILLHVVNHGTYHRGNVTGMMYESSVLPPTTDYSVFVTENLVKNSPIH